MDEYTRDFVQESEENITRLNNSLLDLERSPDDGEAMDEVFRMAHTLKGNAGAMGYDEASDLAHAIEDRLDDIRSGRLEVTPDLMDEIFDAVDQLEAMVDEVRQHGEPQRDPTDTIEHLHSLAPEDVLTPPSDSEIETAVDAASPPEDDHNVYLVRLDVEPSDSVNNGLRVVEALVDAFDLLGTVPDRDAIDAGEYGGELDAVFGTAVTEEAISTALEPVDAVAEFVIADVTERFGPGPSSQTEDVAEGRAGATPGGETPDDMSVDELLEEFDDYDDLDEMVEHVEDTEGFDELGDYGSFDDIEVELDVDAPDPLAETGGAGMQTAPDATETGAASDESAATEADGDDSEAPADDEEVVDDATETFKELQEEVDPVGFDELQDELDELEFDQYDQEEEVGFDELLSEEELEDDEFDPFGGALEEAETAAEAEAAANEPSLEQAEATSEAQIENVDPEALIEEETAGEPATSEPEATSGAGIDAVDPDELLEESGTGMDFETGDEAASGEPGPSPEGADEPEEAPEPAASGGEDAFADDLFGGPSADAASDAEDPEPVDAQPEAGDEEPESAASDAEPVESEPEPAEAAEPEGEPTVEAPSDSETAESAAVEPEPSGSAAVDRETAGTTAGVDDRAEEPSTEPAPDDVESAGEHVDAEEADAEVQPGARETEATAGGDTDTETESMEGVEAEGGATGPIEAPPEPETADRIEETASEADSTEAAPETESPAATESAEAAEASGTADPGEASDPSEPDAPGEEPAPASDTTDEGARASGDAAEFTPDIEFDTGDEVTFEEDYEEFEDVASSGSVPESSAAESGSSSGRSEPPSVEETAPSTAPDVASDFGDSDDFAPDVDFGTDVDVSSSMSSEMPAEPPATDSSDEPADGTEAVEVGSTDASEGSADTTGSDSVVSTDASIEEEFPETVDADLDSVDFESVDATVEFGPDPSEGEAPEETSADDREDVDEELEDVEVGEFDVDETADAAEIDVDPDDLTAEIEAADEAFADLDLEDSSGDPDFDGLDRDFGMGASAGMRSDAESGTAASDEGGHADRPGLPVEIVSEPEELPDRDVDLDELLPTPPQELTGADGEEADETQSIRVDIDRIDELLNLVEGLVTTRARLRRSVESGESLAAIDQEVDDLEDLVGELQDTVMDVRLVPLSTVANRLPRTVRDIARDQDKQVSFEMEGGDVEVDRSILDDIDDPLMHLVRNAVDHGIEPPEEREATDKDPTGTVTLSARRRRDQVVIEVQDDGRGLDPDRLREEAVDQGLLSNEEAQDLSDEQTYELVFESGFSTTADVTDVSGRGVGMDVVSTTVEELGGTVTIDSEPGEGTTASMTLPVTVAISDVMFVRSGEEEFGVPLKAVEEVDGMGRVEPVDGEECLVDGEDTYPLVRLAETLETGGITRDGDGKLVKLRKDVRRIAIHCDEVRGQQEVVVRPFEGVLGDIPGLSGATVLGEGDVVNILDVNTL